ncbi:MAG: hypothetical protein ACI4EG_01075 [Fusicatenibacter sp.]
MRFFKNAITLPLAGVLLFSALCGCESSAVILSYPDDLSGHIAETIEPGLEIDLEIESPGAAAPAEYGTEALQADEQTMKSFLAYLSDSIESKAVDEWLDGEHHYAVRTEKGSYAEFRQAGDGIAAATEWSYYAPVADEYNYAVIDYYGAGRSTSSFDNTSLYLAHRDFSFASCEEALQYVRDALKILGLINLDLVETLYLDHEIMSDYVKTAAVQDLLDHYGMQYLAERGYDASYDAYSFRFSLSKDGIPLFEEAFWNTTVGYATPNIVVRINKDGVFVVHASECSLFGEKTAESYQMFPAGRVLSDVRAMLQETICPYERRIDGLKLRYIYWRAGNRLLLKPVWIVSVREQEAGPPKDVSAPDGPCEDSYSFFIYDAQTGELLCST